MTRHAPQESARRTRRTVHIVAAFYVGIGLVLATSAALAGDRLSTFLGFLIITGTLGATVLANTVFRIGYQLSAMEHTLSDIQRHLATLTQPNQTESASEAVEANTVTTVTLSSDRPGMVEHLAAATLERDTFPRLVTMMNGSGEGSEPPDQPVETKTDSTPPARSSFVPRDLQREWQVAVRTGDLKICRRILGTLVDTVERAAVEPMEAVLEHMTKTREHEFRTSFTKYIKAGDFARALEVGDEMVDLLSGQPIADEFLRIRSHVIRRSKERETQKSSAFTVVS